MPRAEVSRHAPRLRALPHELRDVGGNQAERHPHEIHMAWSVDPATRTRRMRQRDRDRGRFAEFHAMRSANLFVERSSAEKPFDRQPSHGNDDAWRYQLDLGVEPP